MLETLACWIVLIGAIGASLYQAHRMTEMIRQVDRDLNERHGTWQSLSAREFVNLENKLDGVDARVQEIERLNTFLPSHRSKAKT